jgi:thiol-disulfide isomerase/thioredoxin
LHVTTTFGNSIYKNVFDNCSVDYYPTEFGNLLENNIFCVNGIGNTYLNGATGPTCPEPACGCPPAISWDVKSKRLSSASQPKVDLFIMSFCPYSHQVIPTLWEVKQNNEDVIFDPHFVVYGTRDSPSAMHGEFEMIEDKRQLCILYQYSEYDWWEYVLCIVDKYKNESWDSEEDSPWRKCAAEAELSQTVIEDCVQEYGLPLIQYDYDLSREYGVWSTPTVFIDGNMYTGQRTVEAYTQAIESKSAEGRISALEYLYQTLSTTVSLITDAICSGIFEPLCGLTPEPGECDGTDTSCGSEGICVNCNLNDECYDGYWRNYYCVSNEDGCSFTSACTEECCDAYYGSDKSYCGDGVCHNCLQDGFYCDPQDDHCCGICHETTEEGLVDMACMHNNSRATCPETVTSCRVEMRKGNWILAEQVWDPGQSRSINCNLGYDYYVYAETITYECISGSIPSGNGTGGGGRGSGDCHQTCGNDRECCEEYYDSGCYWSNSGFSPGCRGQWNVGIKKSL